MVTFTSILRIGSLAKRLIGQIGDRWYNDPNSVFSDVQQSLDRLPDAVMRETATANEQSIANIKRDLMAYPEQSMTSRYVRTYTLQHGWSDAPITTVNTMDGVLGAKVTNVTNPVPYTSWVQQRATQARWNRGRWRTVEDAVEKFAPAILDRVITALTVFSNGF